MWAGANGSEQAPVNGGESGADWSLPALEQSGSDDPSKYLAWGADSPWGEYLSGSTESGESDHDSLSPSHLSPEHAGSGWESDRTGSTLGSGSDDERARGVVDDAPAAAAPPAANSPAEVDLGRLTSGGIFGQAAPAVPASAILGGIQLMPVGSGSMACEPCAPARPPPEPAKLCCPYCNASVIRRGESGVGKRPVVNRFAQYLPRSEVRKENRLAAWYAKYGYSGPPYCKACAESFNSHLLKQAVRSSRAKCTRDQPCDRCTCILDGFKIQPQELFATVDARKTSRPKKRAQAEPLLAASSASTKGGPTKRKRAAKLAAVSAVGLMLFGAWGASRGGPAPQPAPAAQQQQHWTCGAAFTSLLTEDTTSAADVATICDGADPTATFPCDIDECAASGLVPVGQRTCRCDGCVQEGARCAGWSLEGRGDGPLETGCAAKPPSYLSDPPYLWHVPGTANCMQCQWLCDAYDGCKQSDCGLDRDTHMTRNVPDPDATTDPTTCTVESAEAWPQPTITGLGGMQERLGLLWTAGEDQNEVWLWTLDDGGALDGLSGVSEMERDGPDAELQLMWKYDRRSAGWQPQRSSLSLRPTARSAPARWTDSTGSLFLFGGLADDPSAGQDRPIPASTVSSPTRDGAVIELNDLWRYDTESLAWQLIHAPSNSSSAAGQKPWPAARTRATLWRDAAPDAHSTTVWMFGGISSVNRPGLSRIVGAVGAIGTTPGISPGIPGSPGVGIEFWRYSYAYESGGSSAARAARVGEWTLVSGLPNQQRSDVQPIKACIAASDCPPSRVDAGSWSSPHQQAGGWIFGGRALSVVTPPKVNYPSGEAPAAPASPTTLLPGSSLADLWNFNGDMTDPRWTQAPPPPLLSLVSSLLMSPVPQVGDVGSMWPPGWSEPAGWTTDVDGGELWIVGDSGEQLDTAGLQSDVVSSMWIFRIADGTWDHLTVPAVRGGAQLEWPAARTQAAVADGAMFGGLINDVLGGECAPTAAAPGSGGMDGPGDAEGDMWSDPAWGGGGDGMNPPILSGLWRWVDQGRE